MSDFTDLNPAPNPTPGTPPALLPPDPIAQVDPGADTAPTTIDDNAGPDTDPERSIASMLDEAEDRLDEAERTVADLLVQKMTDIPIEREDINLSLSGDSTRPNGESIGATAADNAPVVAAVDMSKQGGFDADGVWHDSFGRYAKKGWSGLKRAALELIAGETARGVVDDEGPTKLRLKDRRIADRFDLDSMGLVLARYGDAEHALVESRDGRPVRVPWSSFDESDMRRTPPTPPSLPWNPLAIDEGGPAVNELADAPRWEDQGPDTTVPEVGDEVLSVRNGSVNRVRYGGIVDFHGQPRVKLDNPKGSHDLYPPDEVEFYADEADALDAAGRQVFKMAAASDHPPKPDAGGWHSYVVEMRQAPLGKHVSRQEEVGGNLTPAYEVNTPAIRARTPEEAISKAGASSREWPTGRVRAWGDTGAPQTFPIVVDGNPVDPETGRQVRGPGPRPTLDMIRGRDPKRTLTFEAPPKDKVKFGRKQYGSVEWSVPGTLSMGSLTQDADGMYRSGGGDPAKTRYEAVVNDMRSKWEKRNPDPQAAYDAEQAEILADRQSRLLEQTRQWEQARDDHAAALARLGIDTPVVNELADRPGPTAGPIGPDSSWTPPVITDGRLRLADRLDESRRHQADRADDITRYQTMGDLDAEITDAEETIAHIEQGIPTLEDALTAQYDRSDDVYGPRSEWPADAEMQMRDMEANLTGQYDRLADTHEYLNDLTLARTRNTGVGTGDPTVNELTTRRTTALERIRTQVGLPAYDLSPRPEPLPARFLSLWTGDSIRTLALDTNGGIGSPEAERIVAGRPIIDVAWTEDGTVLRTPGILDPDGGFLAAGDPERLLAPKGLDMAPDAIAEAAGRSLAGWGADVRVRRAGDLSGRLVYLGEPTVNELAEAPTVVPPLDEQGHFATVDRVTEDALVWRVTRGPAGETIHETSIVGQYQGDGPAAPLNAINVKIVETPQSAAGLGGTAGVTWSVDAANPIVTRKGQWDARYVAGGTVDPYAWNDPLEAPSWTAEGSASGMFFDGTLLEQAKADAVWEINNLPAVKTFRPLNMDHTVDGPAAAARAVDTDPGQGDLFEPVVNELALSTPARSYTTGDFAGYQQWIADRNGERADRFATMDDATLIDIVAQATEDLDAGGTPRDGIPTSANPTTGDTVMMSPRDAMADLAAERWAAAAELRRRGTLPDEYQGYGKPRPVINELAEQPMSAQIAGLDLTGLTGDQLAVAYDGLSREAAAANLAVPSTDAPGYDEAARAVDVAQAARRAVSAEITARGYITHPASDGRTLVGPPEMFTPIDENYASLSPYDKVKAADPASMSVDELERAVNIVESYSKSAGGVMRANRLGTDEHKAAAAEWDDAQAQADRLEAEVERRGYVYQPTTSGTFDLVKASDKPLTVLNPPIPVLPDVNAPTPNKLRGLPRWTSAKRTPDDRGRSTPLTDAEKALETSWDFNVGNSEDDARLIRVRHAGGNADRADVTNALFKAPTPLNPDVLAVYGQEGKDRVGNGGFTHNQNFKLVATVSLKGSDARLISGNVQIPVPGGPDRDPETVAKWAAQVIGDLDAAIDRTTVTGETSPLAAIGETLKAPTPHGVVLIRGSMFQPFFDARSIDQALTMADSRLGVRGAEGYGATPGQTKYEGRTRFSRVVPAEYGTPETKVLVLDETSAARWHKAYDGVLADTARFKDERKQWIAARKAARQAQQQVLPTTNDLVEMPPLDRARAQSPTLLVTKDNYLSRLGVEKGQAVAVRYRDDDAGEIDVLDGQQVRTQDVKWDRFADTAPAGAPRVDVPEVTGNAAVRSKAEAAQATANRVQAAGATGAPVEVADSYLTRYGAPKGSIVTVSYFDDRKAVLNVDGRQVKAGWDRFTQRVPVPDDRGGWTLEEPAVEPQVNELIDRGADDQFRSTVLRQIGSMNVLAISGGRVEMIHETSDQYADGVERTEPIGVRLPVAAGYRVDVVLDRASDTYTVNRVFARGGKDFPKGTMTGIYAEQVGDVAYSASIYTEPFGTPQAGSDEAQMSLLDLAPTEVRVIAQATPEYTSAGWYPTDAVGGFRSPDGGVRVRRDRTGAGEMHWHAHDTRGDGIYVRGDSYVGTSPEAVMDWVKGRDLILSTTPVDTTKTIPDRRLAELAADREVTIAGTRSLPSATKPYGIVATMPGGRTETLGSYRTPQEARGAEQDIRRRLATLPDDVVDQALAKAPTRSTAADVKASAVRPDDWVVAIQGEALPNGGYRLDGVGAEPNGIVRLVPPPGNGDMVEIPSVATVSILRPSRLPDLGDDPKYTDAVSPDRLAYMGADQLAAVRRVAATQASVTPIGSPANAQAVNMVATIDATVAVHNEMAARPMRDFKVEMTTATGGRFVDTVKARTPHEAMQRANRANGHYTGGRWYAVSAAPDAEPIVNEVTDNEVVAMARDHYNEVQGRRDALRLAASAAGIDPNTAAGVKEAEQEMDRARTALYAAQGLDAIGAPIRNEMAPAPLPDYLGTPNEPTAAPRRAVAPGMGSADGKDVVETSIRLGAGDLPPQSGTAPIPEGTIRLYHYPQGDPDLARTLRNGVLAGDERPVWAQTRPPVADVVPYVEFWVPSRSIGLGGPGYGHVVLIDPVPPGNIVSYNTPTVDALRHLRSLDWDYARLAGLRDRYPVGSPERNALDVRLAELGVPDTAEFRPFDMVRRAKQTPSRQMLAALAASGVPNGDGRVLSPAEIEKMTPSELVSLDKAMSRWLASHPYGDYSGADPLDTSVALDTPTEPEPAEPTPIRPRPADNGGTLGFIPMSPLDAPGDYEAVAAGLDLVDVELWDPTADIVDVPMVDTVVDVPLTPTVVAAMSLTGPQHDQRVAASRAAAERRRARGKSRALAKAAERRPATGTPKAPKETAQQFFDAVNHAFDTNQAVTGVDPDKFDEMITGMGESGYQTEYLSDGHMRVTDPRNPRRSFTLTRKGARP